MPSIGAYDHVAALEAPGAPVPDGHGGFTEAWTPLDPATWFCAIEPATQRSLEELGAGTAVLSQATHIVRGWYHPGLTTQARLKVDGRILNVIYVTNRGERGIESQLVCAEVVI